MADGYSCGTCNVGFPTKRELIEHMHDKHNSPFLEGDWAKDSIKILNEKAQSKTQEVADVAKAHLAKYL